MTRPDLVAEAALILDGGDGAEADRLVRRLCEEVLRWLGPQFSSLRARVAAGLSRACIYLDDVDAAVRASEHALSVASQCDDRAAVVASLRARQLVRCDPDGTRERFDLAAQLLEIGREASDPETQMWAHLWRIDVMFQRGDLAGVGRELDPLAWCVNEIGGPVARWQLLRCRAAHAQAQARFTDAIRLANEGFTELIPLSAWIRDAVLAITGHHIGPEVSGGARDGVAVVDARDLISDGNRVIAALRAEGYIVPPFPMPELSVLADPNFRWPDADLPVHGAHFWETSDEDLSIAAATVYGFTASANMTTGVLKLSARSLATSSQPVGVD